MRCILLFLFLNGAAMVQAQTKTPADFGCRYDSLVYEKQVVHILIQSRKGEEEKRKPLLFFCQGSLPQPLLKFDSVGNYAVFPFQCDSLLADYHLVIAGKPGVPLLAHAGQLLPDHSYVDSKGQFPKSYLSNNYLDYYVSRNKRLLDYLLRKPWVNKEQLVVAGHSEGSIIAAKMATVDPRITRLIYSGGNPMGRILTIVAQARAEENDTSAHSGEAQIDYWGRVVTDKENTDGAMGDPNKTTYGFSLPPIDYLNKLKIPTLICYGTKDWNAPFCDFFRVSCITNQRNHFFFNAYIGTQHNYFPLQNNGKPDFAIFNWDRVAMDWWRWLRERK